MVHISITIEVPPSIQVEWFSSFTDAFNFLKTLKLSLLYNYVNIKLTVMTCWKCVESAQHVEQIGRELNFFYIRRHFRCITIQDFVKTVEDCIERLQQIQQLVLQGDLIEEKVLKK